MKTITIRDRTWKRLSSLKKPGESFSDVIDSLLVPHMFCRDIGHEREKVDMKKYFGILRDSKALDEIETFSRELRNNTRTRI